MKLFNKKNLISFKTREDKNQKKGFVILFAVILTSIILSVSLGLADITYKEISFATSAKNTGEAFFAADTGAECAIYYDYTGAVTLNGFQNPFGYVPTTGNDLPTLNCAGKSFGFEDGYSATGPWIFILPELGVSGKACAIVTVTKDFNLPNDPDDDVTTVSSKGYNVGSQSCTSSSPTRVEREILLNI